jgi:A nuclease of the HNH/ENDO VII superfamily with conserved WHH
MLGDPDFLLDMEGLQLVVSQDLSRIKGKNAGLNVKLKELLAQHKAAKKVWSEAEIVIQVGLLFVPGAGPFLSALAGFAISAKHVSADLRRWTASQASVNPAAALVDQRVAEAQLARNTIELAANAVFVATETINALKTLDSAKGAEKLEGALKELEEKEAKHASQTGDMVVKPDVAGVRGEVGGIPDAFGGSAHDLRITERGLERCSFVCWIFSASLQSRAKNVKASLKATPDIAKTATALEARAESIGGKAVKLSKLPEPQRSIQEGLLLGEARNLEMEMYELEHKVLGMPSTRLPAKGEWTGAPGNSHWLPPPDSPAYKYAGPNGIPFHDGYPNFREWALPASDVSLPAMTGIPGHPVSADFAAADAIAAARSGMADAAAFKGWREASGYTWHHVENSMTMLLVPSELHAAVAHAGGGKVARGIPVNPATPAVPVP